MYNNKIFNKSFSLLFFSNFIVFIGFEMLLPVLPAYLNTMNASAVAIGLVTSLFTVGSIFIRPIVGHYLLTYNKKMMALFITLGLLMLTTLYPIVSTVGLLLVLRFIHGSFWGASTTINNTMAVDYLPRHKLGEGIGYFSMSTTVGAIIAQSLGIWVYHQFSFHILIIAASILNLIAFVLMLPMDTIQPEKNKKPKFNYWKNIFLKEIALQSILVVLTTVSFGAVVTFLVIYGEEQKISNVFLFFVVNAITSTVLRPFTGKWYDRQGPHKIIIYSAILGFLSMFVLSLTVNTWLLILSAILFGASYGTVMSCLQAWAIQSVNQSQTGIATAAFFSSFDIGFGLSALFLSILAQWIPIKIIFLLSGASFLIVSIFVWMDARKNK